MDTATLAVPDAPRLAPVERIELAEHLIDLVAAAIRLGHPHAARLGRLSECHFYYRASDRVLVAGIEHLTAFVADQAAEGNLLPSWHRLYVAPGGR